MAKAFFNKMSSFMKSSESMIVLKDNEQTDYGSHDDNQEDNRETLKAQGTYTVQQALDSMTFGKFHVKLSFLTGLAWGADSMEMMILSILSPALHCAWMLSSWKQALITTIVFCGQFLSSIFWGWVCDKFGRKASLIFSTVVAFFYGILSAFAPTFGWMLFLRCMVGVGVGGCAQSITLYSEFLPTSLRARGIVFVELFWTIGSCFEVLLSLIVMPTLGWRYLLGFSAIPLLIFTIFCIFLPESPRFDMTRGRPDLASNTLESIAKSNKCDLPPGKLLLDASCSGTVSRGHIQDLFTRELRLTSCILWFLWLICGFSYFGIVLLTTTIFASGASCSGPHTHTTLDTSCLIHCKNLSTGDYVNILWTTIAEIPGLLLTALVVDYIGRKRNVSGLLFIFSFFVFMLHICTTKAVLTFLLVMARAAIAGGYQAVIIYTPEVYPTQVRALGLGYCSALSRIGAIITPYVAQVLVQKSPRVAISMYGVLSLLAAVAVLFLPFETQGKDLRDVVSQDTETKSPPPKQD